MGLVRALRCTVVPVERRGQGSTELVHRVLRQAVPQLREAVTSADRRLPSFVWRELENSMRAGTREPASHG